MRIQLPKLKFSEWLYFISFSIYLTYFLLYTSLYAVYIDFASGIVRAVCGILLLSAEAFQTASRKSVISFLIIGLFSVMTLFMGGSGIINTLLFIYAARNVRLEKVMRIAQMISTVILIFVILSSLAGIIPNYMMARSTGVRRYCLGFRYVLYPSTILFNITAITVYLKKNAIRWRTILLLLALNYIIYLPTNARLSFGVSCMIIMVAIVLKIKPNFLQKRRILCALFCSMFIVCFVSSIMLCIFYSDSIPVMKDIDAFMGGRISYAKNALMIQGFGLVPRRIQYNGYGLDIYGHSFRGNYFDVDNLYIQGLQVYGALFMLAYVLLNTFAMYQCYRRKEWHLLCIMVVLALRGLIDDLSFLLHYNAFLIVIGPMLLSSFPYRRQWTGKNVLAEKPR